MKSVMDYEKEICQLEEAISYKRLYISCLEEDKHPNFRLKDEISREHEDLLELELKLIEAKSDRDWALSNQF